MSLSSKIGSGVVMLRNAVTSPTPADLSHVTYAVNNFCNNKCVMCNIWQVYRQEPHLIREELSADEIRRGFEESRYLRGVKHLLLTGGEPILKDEFVDIYLFLVDFNPRINISIASNGRATALIVRKLQAIREGLNQRGLSNRTIGIGLSLDGYAAMHDRVRGVPGLFQTVLKTIEEVSKLPDIKLALSFTIGPHNYNDFLTVHELARDLQIGLAYRCVQTSGIYYRNDGERACWKPEQLAELGDALQYVEQQARRERPIHRKLIDLSGYYNEMMMEYERQPRRLFECYSGTHSVFLDAYGNVMPCIIRAGSFGNIKETSFDEIWESEKAREVRRSIAAHECHCCVDCEVNPSLARQSKGYVYNINRLLSRDEV